MRNCRCKNFKFLGSTRYVKSIVMSGSQTKYSQNICFSYTLRCLVITVILIINLNIFGKDYPVIKAGTREKYAWIVLSEQSIHTKIDNEIMQKQFNFVFLFLTTNVYMTKYWHIKYRPQPSLKLSSTIDTFLPQIVQI